jgi:hypothetical protein
VVAYGPSTGSMLAASADRDRAVDVLRAAFVEGRLTQAEFSQRVARVQASRTYNQLAELVGDLPIGPHVPALIPRSSPQDGTQHGPGQHSPGGGHSPGGHSPGTDGPGGHDSGQLASAQPGSAAAENNDRQAATPLAHLALTALVVFTLAALFTALIVYMHILGQPTNVQLSPGMTQLQPAQFPPAQFPQVQLMPALSPIPHTLPTPLTPLRP